jgi:hypothetical protein
MPQPLASPVPPPVTHINAADPFAEIQESELPEEDFWDKFNARLEFPLSILSSVFFHILMMATIVFVIVRLMPQEDRSPTPVQLIEVAGLDEGGLGSAGSGGFEDPLVRADADPDRALVQSLPEPNQLPEIREEIRQTIRYLDEQGQLPISAANAAAYASLEESIRKKLLGARVGSGAGPGSGYDGSSGKGPGGSGADSTLGRNLRWVLRFRVSSGRDYIEQLRAMQAKVLVPIPGSDKCVFFPDLQDLSRHRIATDEDLKTLAQQIKFCDSRREAVLQVAGTLGLDFKPNAFWAFFPKGLEEELARLERNYRNRRPEDIEETIFRVTFRANKTEVVVEEQRPKR